MRALPVVLVTLGCVSGPPARHQMPAEHVHTARGADPAVLVYESTTTENTTEGETTIDATPEVAYAQLENYAIWPTIFPDIYTVTITKRDGVDARVTFLGPDDHRDNIHFHNRPADHTIWFEDTGGTAVVWAEIAFQPGPQPGTTRVHSKLFADVGGIAGWFVTDNRTRKMRQQRVYDDLYDLHAHFAHH